MYWHYFRLDDESKMNPRNIRIYIHSFRIGRCLNVVSFSLCVVSLYAILGGTVLSNTGLRESGFNGTTNPWGGDCQYPGIVWIMHFTLGAKYIKVQITIWKHIPSLKMWLNLPIVLAELVLISLIITVIIAADNNSYINYSKRNLYTNVAGWCI